jgi:hypothetical protein
MDNVFNERQMKAYQLMAFFTLYRVNNDIDELNKRVSEINKTIEEKSGKKFSLNMFREGNVKNLTKEIDYKKGFLESLKNSIKAAGLDPEAIDTSKASSIANEVFDDDLKLSRYLMLSQVLQEPLYYNYANKTFEYDEEQKEFSLSNISTFLGLENKAYDKLSSDSEDAGRKLGISLVSKFAFTSLGKNPLVLNYVSPLSVPTIGDPSYLKVNLIGECNCYDGINLIGLLTLLPYDKVIVDKMLPSDKVQKTLLDMEIDEARAYGYSLILLVSRLSGDKSLKAHDLLQLLLENFLDWKNEYEKGILLGTLNEPKNDEAEGKFRVLNEILEALVDISLK